MKCIKWIAMFGLMAILLAAVTDEALAQRRGGGGQPRQLPPGFTPYMELSATYGSMWGGNIDLSYGLTSRKIRTGTGPSYAFAFAYNLHPMQAVELSYTRQDGSLDLDYKGLRTLTDMSVNVWHIGSVRFLAPPGSVRPFVLASLGATYFSPESATITFDEDDPANSTFTTQTSTKFSFSFGLGVKSYFGEAEKIGIRASFKVMPTLYNTSGGLWFGGGGSGVAVSGNALWQWEAAIGLTVKLGG